jgi:hypothetical protein
LRWRDWKEIWYPRKTILHNHKYNFPTIYQMAYKKKLKNGKMNGSMDLNESYLSYVLKYVYKKIYLIRRLNIQKNLLSCMLKICILFIIWSHFKWSNMEWALHILGSWLKSIYALGQWLTGY